MGDGILDPVVARGPIYVAVEPIESRGHRYSRAPANQCVGTAHVGPLSVPP
jgi:hypothetical protein